MTYNYLDKKVVAVLSSDLQTGVALNVIGHLAIALGAHADADLMGRHHLVDASGLKHTGIAKYPLIITKVKPSRLRRLITDVRQYPEILLFDYPSEMLTTGHDDELAASLAAKRDEDIVFLGAILYGATDRVSQLTGHFTLWH